MDLCATFVHLHVQANYMTRRTSGDMNQTQKFEPWRSDAEHATSRSRRLSIILILLQLDREETFTRAL